MTALLLTPLNVERVLGLKWRWVRELAARHGIAVLNVGGKRLLPVQPVMAALAREAEQNAREAAPVEDSEAVLLERMREQCGLERAV